MRIFVTGAGGFAGSFLVDLLERTDCALGGSWSRTQGRPGDERFRACDVQSYGQLRSLVADFGPEAVIHLAAKSNPSESFHHPRDHFENNLRGTVNLLEAVRTSVPKARVLVVSSAQVYSPGRPGLLLTEDSPTDPGSPYACSKFLAEQAALNYAEVFGLHALIARPFNHAGPGQSESYVISDFCHQIALKELDAQRGDARPSPENGLSIDVGRLDTVRDFLDVRDVVDAYYQLVQKGKAGEVYNVCSGQEVTIGQVLKEALRLSRAQIGFHSRAERRREADQISLVGDNVKIRDTLGWTPQISLQQTIEDTLQYWRVKLAKPD